jgi:hypothetical protein
VRYVAIMTEDEARRALARHEQERQAVWSEPPQLLNAPEQYTVEGSEGFIPLERRPGRQEAFYNRNMRTFQSREAAQFVHEEMQLFREHNEVPRVPKLVRNRFWQIAKSRYPAAEESIVWDHVRMNRKRL